jgi:hypothetical protein
VGVGALAAALARDVLDDLVGTGGFEAPDEGLGATAAAAAAFDDGGVVDVVVVVVAAVVVVVVVDG